MSDEVGVEPERLNELASALENLRDVLAANVPVIVNTMESYWNGGTGQSVNLMPLKQAEARSPHDAAEMRARSNLARAWMDNSANIDLVTGGMAYITWNAPDAQDAALDAQELAAAEKSGNLQQIQAIEQDIHDHLDEGSAGQPFLTAFYNQAAPQVANLAASLYTKNGTLKQPLTSADQKVLATYTAGLAAVTKNGSLSAPAAKALTDAPDMWSMAMLIKYGPDAKAYGPGGQGLLQAVNNATVQISPHVIVDASDPEIPALRAAWAWAAQRHISLASTPGDVVFLADPRSLLGAKPEDVQKLIPEEYTGPKALNKGDGWTYNAKGRAIRYEEGNPTGNDLGQPDSLMHRGPYYKISENGYVYRIAAEGSPALSDPNAATISITAPDGTKTYIYENLPTDDPGDGDGRRRGPRRRRRRRGRWSSRWLIRTEPEYAGERSNRRAAMRAAQRDRGVILVGGAE